MLNIFLGDLHKPPIKIQMVHPLGIIPVGSTNILCNVSYFIHAFILHLILSLIIMRTIAGNQIHSFKCVSKIFYIHVKTGEKLIWQGVRKLHPEVC